MDILFDMLHPALLEETHTHTHGQVNDQRYMCVKHQGEGVASNNAARTPLFSLTHT